VRLLKTLPRSDPIPFLIRRAILGIRTAGAAELAPPAIRARTRFFERHGIGGLFLHRCRGRSTRRVQKLVSALHLVLVTGRWVGWAEAAPAANDPADEIAMRLIHFVSSERKSLFKFRRRTFGSD